MKSKDLNIGLQCIKYLLLAINFLFVITGILLIAVGTTSFVTYHDFLYLWGAYNFSPSILLIIVGVYVTITAFFGCCGALKQSTCMVLFFSVSLGLALVLEISVAIAAFALKSEVASAVVQGVRSALEIYMKEPNRANYFLRKDLHCCQFTNQAVKPINEAAIKKCCTWEVYKVNPLGSEECTNLYGMNCVNALSNVLEQNAIYIFSSIAIISILQLIGIFLACTLGHAIRRQKTQREMQRMGLTGDGTREHYPVIGDY